MWQMVSDLTPWVIAVTNIVRLVTAITALRAERQARGDQGAGPSAVPSSQRASAIEDMMLPGGGRGSRTRQPLPKRRRGGADGRDSGGA